jgi:hypothetical protein
MGAPFRCINRVGFSQVSISPIFYEDLLRQNPFAKKITNPNCKHIKSAQRTFIWKSCLVEHSSLFYYSVSDDSKKFYVIVIRPCPASIDPQKLVRDLGKEVRLAERISNRCNPPKPERESKRKKQKKELNEDFVDITQVPAPKKLRRWRYRRIS